MSTLRTNTLQNAAGSKSVPVDTVVDGTAKAWVNFNAQGTVAIRRAFNVSSITDNGTGDFTVNFTTALTDADFCAQITAGDNTSNYLAQRSVTYTSTGFRFYVINNSGGGNDSGFCNVAFFR